MITLIGGSPIHHKRIKAQKFIEHVRNHDLEVSYHHPYGFQAGDYEVYTHPTARALWNFLNRLQPALSFTAYDRLLRHIWVAHMNGSSLRVSYQSD